MNFINITEFDINQVHVAHRTLASGKTVINVRYGEMHKALSFVTPPAVTFYPRINGDGNYREGAQFGPASRDKAQYTLDLTCANIGEHENTAMIDFQDNIISAVDDAVLTYVHANQTQLLGRRNLNREEVKMLQIRSSRTKIDKMTDMEGPKSVNLSSKKFYWDQVGNHREREINVSDRSGNRVDANLLPGDVVAATTHLDMVYNGVGGDKFGCHWSLGDVAVICQAHKLGQSSHVNAFCSQNYESLPYSTEFSSVNVSA